MGMGRDILKNPEGCGRKRWILKYCQQSIERMVQNAEGVDRWTKMSQRFFRYYRIHIVRYHSPAFSIFTHVKRDFLYGHENARTLGRRGLYCEFCRKMEIEKGLRSHYS